MVRSRHAGHLLTERAFQDETCHSLDGYCVTVPGAAIKMNRTTLSICCLVLATVARHRRSPARRTANGAPTAATSATRATRRSTQINRDNFNQLEVAWRFKTDSLGPRPEYNFQGTPLMVNGKLYSTAGSRRSGRGARRRHRARCCGCTARMRANAATPRRGNCPARGLAYWTDGKEERILYVTPGLPVDRARREDRRPRARLRHARRRRFEAG